MKLRHLLFSTRGRIGRAKWWLTIWALAIVSRGLAGIAAGFVDGFRGDVLVTLIYLNLWLAPAYAVSAKRLQDQGKPGTKALYGLIPAQIAMLLPAYGLARELDQPTTIGWLSGFTEWGVELWFAVELGLRKGLEGANRFGPDPRVPAIPSNEQQEAIIENRVFAYTVALAGLVIMVVICNSFAWLLMLPGTIPVFLAATPDSAGQPSLGPIALATSLVVLGFALPSVYLGLPFARLALRWFPTEPIAERKVRRRTIIATGLLALIPILAFCAMNIIGLYRYAVRFVTEDWVPQYQRETEIQEALVRLAWGGILLATCSIFCRAQLRAARVLEGPFVLFLRRFSRFADRSLIVDLLKTTPNGVPLVFIASRSDHARNWDPFLWAFGGLRWLRPLKNLPLQLHTRDEEWVDTVTSLVTRARCIIVDVSETSPSLEVERRLIESCGASERVVALLDGRLPVSAVAVTSPFPRPISYRPSFWNAPLSRLVKVVTVFMIWAKNVASLSGWIVLLTLPFLIVPSIPRSTRRELHKVLQARLGSDGVERIPASTSAQAPSFLTPEG